MNVLVELWPMILTWTAVVVLGGLVTLYALRSWRRSGTPSMLALGGGFAVLSVGTASSWFGVYLWSENPLMASLGCSSLIAAGFATILVGLRSRLG